MNKSLLLILISAVLMSCGTEPIPKPRGEIRLDYGPKAYSDADTGCPYTFELEEKCVMADARSGPGRCWKDLHFPIQHATLHLTYSPIEDNLAKLLKDSRDLTYEHHIKASNIESELVIDSEHDVYGLVYQVSGDVASTSQFYLTDSTHHFLRGALYFNCKPNWDSLMPSVKYIEEDIAHMISTFRWTD